MLAPTLVMVCSMLSITSWVHSCVYIMHSNLRVQCTSESKLRRHVWAHITIDMWLPSQVLELLYKPHLSLSTICICNFHKVMGVVKKSNPKCWSCTVHENVPLNSRNEPLMIVNRYV